MHAIWWLRYGVCTRALKGCALNLNPKPYVECVLGHTFFRVRKGQHSARGFRFSAHPCARDCHLVYIHCGHLFKKKKGEHSAFVWSSAHWRRPFWFHPLERPRWASESKFLKSPLFYFHFIKRPLFDSTLLNDLVELARVRHFSKVLFSTSLHQKSSFRFHPLHRPRWAGESKPFSKKQKSSTYWLNIVKYTSPLTFEILFSRQATTRLWSS